MDATFLSSGVHVNVDVDSVNDVEELPTPGEGQSRTRPKKWPTELSQSSGKRKKGGSIETMAEEIWGFIEMRNRRGKNSIDIGESFVGGEQESIMQVVSLLNEHIDVDHFTYCKVVTELHNPKSRTAFFAIMVDRIRAWIEFVGGGLQQWWGWLMVCAV